MQELFENYLAVLLAAVTGGILVLTAVIGAKLLAPFSKSRGKATPYECGMLPIGRVRTQIHIRYYVYAILFLIFDVEAVFLFPWVISFVQLGDTALFSMLFFITVLGAGLAYAWKKGALEWK